MIRASNTFTVLQAIAAIVAFALILWSLGVPSLRFAEAANVTSLSDTLSDSAPSVAADHTIEFVTPTGVAATESISIAFPTEFTGFGSLDFNDVDLLVNSSDETLGATAVAGTWGVSVSGETVTIESQDTTIAPGDTVTIKIGTNATAGVNQITNPVTATSYEIDVTAGSADSGSMRVAIIDSVTVTASVETLFTFTVTGVAAGTTVNTGTTGGDTTATAIPFGSLEAGTASTAAQALEVKTNAANGYVVTVQTDQQLTSANGAEISSFVDGSDSTTASAWTEPSATPGLPDTYGHWGVSSNDTTLSAGSATDLYTGGDNFVAILNTPVEVMRHSGPTDGTGAGVGIADVIYNVEISALQEAAEDYTATLTYVATPVF